VRKRKDFLADSALAFVGSERSRQRACSQGYGSPRHVLGHSAVAILALLSTFQVMCITQQEYDESTVQHQSFEVHSVFVLPDNLCGV